jgi:NhaA family Na+:H+ antiporter
MSPAINRGAGRSALRHFLDSEALGGMLLIGAAILALIAVNGPFAESYKHALEAPLGPSLGGRAGRLTLHHWINDGMMAVFFLLVGLEIKRELTDGRLVTWADRRLPLVAAGAGMAVPALIYLVATAGRADLAVGWAIPAATDIAFALGVLALLGSRAPTSLKLFLTAVAIIDDMGAVAIIAIVYTPGLELGALAAAAALLLAMFALNRLGVKRLAIFLPLAIALWYAVLLSGVHATVAGVLAAFTIPIVRTPGAPDSPVSPLHRLEHALAPLVAWVVLPVFGFTNAGVALGDTGVGAFAAALPLGVAGGLFLGKQAAIFLTVWLCCRLGISERLPGATWLQVYGVSLLCGIGFTMSLFIGGLAFPDAPALAEEAKLGNLAGSLFSALAGYAVLRFAGRARLRSSEAA